MIAWKCDKVQVHGDDIEDYDNIHDKFKYFVLNSLIWKPKLCQPLKEKNKIWNTVLRRIFFPEKVRGCYKKTQKFTQ
jgi:hypothetical protein